jgi:hypothetical protein
VVRLLAGLFTAAVLLACSMYDCKWEVVTYVDDAEASSELQYSCRF